MRFRCAFTDTYAVPLPRGHRFPMAKYRALRERLVAEGTVPREALLEAPPCEREALEQAHSAEYLDRVFEGRFERADELRLGFPWSEALVVRSRASVQATCLAAEWALEDGLGATLAGGTHHAHRDRGEGFSLFNDVAVALSVLLGAGRVNRAAVVDLDVHQGNGTATIFSGDPRVFTLSLHGRNNWPFEKAKSTLDVEFEDGAGDGEYLEGLEKALDEVFRFRPEIVFYNAGVDPLAGDRLGRLALSREGLRLRDAAVLRRAYRERVPVAIVLGGGYRNDLDELVEAHAEVFRAARALPGS